MKKLFLVLVALVLVCPAFAETAPEVFVSITDADGVLVLAYVPVTVTDVDADGALTIHDALSCAHAQYHPDGAEAYLAEITEFGMSMYRLWGAENGGSYGYCVNDASSVSMLDAVRPGDHVKAYVFTDLTAWSDTYSFFDAVTVRAAVGKEVTLTLWANGFDESWMPVVLPVANATLTINGERADTCTDDAGRAVLTFAQAGTYIVSASSDEMTLVAPVCLVTVE